MKKKNIVRNTFYQSLNISNVQLIFGNGVNEFLDKEKKILYHLNKAHLKGFSIRNLKYNDQYRGIWIIKFPILPSLWELFKRDETRTYGQVIFYEINDTNILNLTKFKLLFSFKIKNEGYLIIKDESIPTSDLEKYSMVHKHRFNCLDDQNKIWKAYISVEHFNME